MSTVKTNGIILKALDLRETSILLKVLTEDFGKMTCVIKGLRNLRSSSGGIPQIFSLNELVVHLNPKRDIFLISEYELLDYFSHIRQNFDDIVAASYMLELCDYSLEDHDKSPEAYNLLKHTLSALNEDMIESSVLLRIYEIKLMNATGILPAFEHCETCGAKLEKGIFYNFRQSAFGCPACMNAESTFHILPGSVRFINHIRLQEIEMLKNLRIGKMIISNLEKFFLLLAEYQMGQVFKTVNFKSKIKRVS